MNKIYIENIDRLKSELEWYRTYSEYINANHPIVCAEASDYADNITN